MEISVTLDQWRALVSVIEEGSHARAAEALGKSPSAISYAIQRIETALGIRAFSLQGRRAIPTPVGELLYRRAVHLLRSAQATEAVAGEFSGSGQARIALAVDTIFPEAALFRALADFGHRYPLTRVSITETVLSGVSDALLKRQVDVAISSQLLPGFMGDPLIRIRFLAVAAPTHPLQRLGRSLTDTDLRQHRQLVVQDAGSQQLDAGWLGAEQRWSFSHLTTSVRAARAGLGYAWYPEPKIRDDLRRGRLSRLPLEHGAERWVTLYVIQAEQEFASPSSLELAALLKAGCAAPP